MICDFLKLSTAVKNSRWAVVEEAAEVEAEACHSLGALTWAVRGLCLVVAADRAAIAVTANLKMT